MTGKEYHNLLELVEQLYRLRADYIDQEVAAVEPDKTYYRGVAWGIKEGANILKHELKVMNT